MIRAACLTLWSGDTVTTFVVITSFAFICLILGSVNRRRSTNGGIVAWPPPTSLRQINTSSGLADPAAVPALGSRF